MSTTEGKRIALLARCRTWSQCVMGAWPGRFASSIGLVVDRGDEVEEAGELVEAVVMVGAIDVEPNSVDTTCAVATQALGDRGVVADQVGVQPDLDRDPVPGRLAITR